MFKTQKNYNVKVWSALIIVSIMGICILAWTRYQTNTITSSSKTSSSYNKKSLQPSLDGSEGVINGSNRYSIVVGSTFNSTDENHTSEPPTQTAWVDPKGGGYYMGDGPFDITDKNGQHHLIDPVKSGWTKTTYNNVKDSYSDLQSSHSR